MQGWQKAKVVVINEWIQMDWLSKLRIWAFLCINWKIGIIVSTSMGVVKCKFSSLNIFFFFFYYFPSFRLICMLCQKPSLSFTLDFQNVKKYGKSLGLWVSDTKFRGQPPQASGKWHIWADMYMRWELNSLLWRLQCGERHVLLVGTRYIVRSASSCQWTQTKAAIHEAGFCCHCVLDVLHQLTRFFCSILLLMSNIFADAAVSVSCYHIIITTRHF